MSKTTAEESRKEGFYWTKKGGKWEVTEWRNSRWQYGVHLLSDLSFQEINDSRLTEPASVPETPIEPDSLQEENNDLKTVLHNVINAACFGNDYYNALYNIIKLVADALPDYETHRQHGVLKPNNLSASNPTGEPVKE
jgi:hypothetical protein